MKCHTCKKSLGPFLLRTPEPVDGRFTVLATFLCMERMSPHFMAIISGDCKCPEWEKKPPPSKIVIARPDPRSDIRRMAGPP